MPTNSDDELLAWLALARVPGLGAIGCRALLEHYGTPSAIFAARPQSCGDERLRDEVSAGLRRPDWAGAEIDRAWRNGPDRHILSLDDPRYPPLLAQQPDAPPVLFVHGDAGLLRAPQLAIVGSRNPTALGRETAETFAAELARAGLVITSGLALGVDGAAHEGALRAGRTVAVCGTGLDRVYPARHKTLAHRIAAQGALVSEFPPGTVVQAANFPRRNRLIAGLSLGTLVVEAALQSGSLITARLALDYGREVFAIPGSIHNPLARGCHALIREGAKLVECAGDVVEELGALAGLDFAEAPVPGGPEGDVRGFGPQGLDAQDRAVLAAVDHAPTAVDTVIARTGLAAPVVSGALLGLELRGLLALTAGGYQRLGS